MCFTHLYKRGLPLHYFTFIFHLSHFQSSVKVQQLIRKQRTPISFKIHDKAQRHAIHQASATGRLINATTGTIDNRQFGHASTSSGNALLEAKPPTNDLTATECHTVSNANPDENPCASPKPTLVQLDHSESAPKESPRKTGLPVLQGILPQGIILSEDKLPTETENKLSGRNLRRAQALQALAQQARLRAQAGSSILSQHPAPSKPIATDAPRGDEEYQPEDGCPGQENISPADHTSEPRRTLTHISVPDPTPSLSPTPRPPLRRRSSHCPSLPSKLWNKVKLFPDIKNEEVMSKRNTAHERGDHRNCAYLEVWHLKGNSRYQRPTEITVLRNDESPTVKWPIVEYCRRKGELAEAYKSIHLHNFQGEEVEGKSNRTRKENMLDELHKNYPAPLCGYGKKRQQSLRTDAGFTEKGMNFLPGTGAQTSRYRKKNHVGDNPFTKTSGQNGATSSSLDTDPVPLLEQGVVTGPQNGQTGNSDGGDATRPLSSPKTSSIRESPSQERRSILPEQSDNPMELYNLANHGMESIKAVDSEMSSPKKLSPHNFANKDVQFAVRQLSVGDLMLRSVNSHDMTRRMLLKWNGKSEEALRIVRGDQERLWIEFQTIQKISYNPVGQYIQFVYSPTMVNQQTAVVAMDSLPSKSWIVLQQFCRQIEKKWKILCNQEETSFFKESIDSMKKKTPYQHTYLDKSNAVFQRSSKPVPPKDAKQTTLARPKSTTKAPEQANKVRNVNAFMGKKKKDQDHAKLSSQVMNILAAKQRHEPFHIPPLITPSRKASVTENLMSAISQAQTTGAINRYRTARLSEDPGDRGSPVRQSMTVDRAHLAKPDPRDTGSPIQRQRSQPAEYLEPSDSRSMVSSLFGSESPEPMPSNPTHSIRAVSQRFTEQLNAAKESSNKKSDSCLKPRRTKLVKLKLTAPVVDMGYGTGSLGLQSGQVTPKVASTRRYERPEEGFEEFLGNLQADNPAREKNKVGSKKALKTSIPSGQVPTQNKTLPSMSISVGPKTKHLAPEEQSSDDFYTPVEKLQAPPQETISGSLFIPVNKLKAARNVHSSGSSYRPARKPQTSSGEFSDWGLYFRNKSGQDILIPLAVNDRVVRLRTKEEKEESGMHSKFDVFDGPWVITEIRKSPNSLPQEFFDADEESDTQAFRQIKWKQMMTTKVKLDFPETSKAKPWVEISRLLPIVDSGSIVTGEVVPSSSTVAQLPHFIELAARLGSGAVGEDATNVIVKKRLTDMRDANIDVVEVRTGKFVAVMDIEPNGIAADSFEVERIRKKRLRLYTKNDARAPGSEQKDTDNWTSIALEVCIVYPSSHYIEMLIADQKYGHLVKNRIIIDEYLVHWAGWAVEDQTWEPRSNFAYDDYIQEFDTYQDPFRNISDDISIPIEELVFKDDLKRLQDAIRKRKRPSTESNRGSSGSKKRNSDRKRRSTKGKGKARADSEEVDDDTFHHIASRRPYDAELDNANTPGTVDDDDDIEYDDLQRAMALSKLGHRRKQEMAFAAIYEMEGQMNMGESSRSSTAPKFQQKEFRIPESHDEAQGLKGQDVDCEMPDAYGDPEISSQEFDARRLSNNRPLTVEDEEAVDAQKLFNYMPPAVEDKEEMDATNLFNCRPPTAEDGEGLEDTI